MTKLGTKSKQIFIFIIIIAAVLFASCSKRKTYFNNITNYYEDYVVSFLGDSITEQCKSEKGYVQLLSEHFCFKKTNNYGVSGTTISGYNRNDAFFQDIRINEIDIESNIVFIYGGINDCLSNYNIGDAIITNEDTSTFIGAYNTIIKKIKSRLNANIVLIGPHYCEVDDFFVNLGLYVDAVRNVATINNVDYIDLYKGIDINSETVKFKTKDGVHLNYEGNILVAEKIAKYLLGR